MNNELLKYLKVAKSVATEAGAIIKKAFEQRQNVSSDSDIQLKDNNEANLVTETDKQVEQYCFSILKSQFPEHSFIGEESTELTPLTNAPTWIIDPIDGTTNFVHGLPFCCVSIGLAIDKIPVVGVIFNPILDELIYASKGNGAFMNDHQPLKKPFPRNINPLSQSIISCEFGNERNDEIITPKLETMTKVLKASPRGLRAIGSCCICMCFTAKGAYDVYYEAGVHSWDICAAIVILRESGGICVNFFKDQNIESNVTPNMETVDLCARNILCIRPGESVEAMESLIYQMREFLVPVDYMRDL